MLVDPRVFAEPQFLRFEIPVAEVVPEEVPKGFRGFMVAMALERAYSYISGILEPLKNPAVFGGAGGVFDLSGLRCPAGYTGALHVHEEPSGGIPDLVRESTGGIDPIRLQCDVGARSSRNQKSNSQGIRA